MTRYAAFAAPMLLLSNTAAAMDLGVNTHFDQGWPVAALDQVAASGAVGIRDGLGWGKVEAAPGVYRFTAPNTGWLDQACARKLSVMLTLTPRNRLYDGGQTVHSEQGRRAFGAFAAAVGRRFACVKAFEIGNEINGHSLKGPVNQALPGGYVAIVRAVREALGQDGPRLLSGSSLSVATGFFETLFSAGLLPLVDGIVVHPYLGVPEQLPVQLERLRAAMARHGGGGKPIYASEFGFYYPRHDDAPPHAIKMITLLSAGGLIRADWYALRDEHWYPNMGLFARQVPNPAFDAFRTAGGRLTSAGRARRIDAGDPLTYAFRFGEGPQILWGSGRAIRWADPATPAWDARGRPIHLPDRLTEEPVLVDAGARFTLGPVQVAGDTLIDGLTDLGIPGSRWSWSVEGVQPTAAPLGWVDWNWTSYGGLPGFPNVRVMPNAVAVARPPRAPQLSLVERFTAPAAGDYRLSACFEGTKQRPVAVRISAGGKDLFGVSVEELVRVPTLTLSLAKGEQVAIRYRAPAPGAHLLRRRVRVLTVPTDQPALCAPSGQDEQRKRAPATE